MCGKQIYYVITEQSKANEEKFKKMKEVYQKLRDEHVTLLRQVNTDLSCFEISPFANIVVPLQNDFFFFFFFFFGGVGGRGGWRGVSWNQPVSPSAGRSLSV